MRPEVTANMATYHEIPKPPQPKGTDEECRKQVFNYLWRLAEQLQAIINGLAALHQEGGDTNASV